MSPIRIHEIEQINGEYLRLLNISNTDDYDLTGYYIQQNISCIPSTRFTFPSNTFIRSGQTITVCHPSSSSSSLFISLNRFGVDHIDIFNQILHILLFGKNKSNGKQDLNVSLFSINQLDKYSPSPSSLSHLCGYS